MSPSLQHTESGRSFFGKWNRDHLLVMLVAFGVVLDWAPAYYLSIDSKDFSFTKFMVVPLIAFDMLTRPWLYILHRGRWVGLAYMLCFFVGVGGGVILGTITFSRLTELLPTTMVLLFFLGVRSRSTRESVLALAAICSLLVPVNLLLAYAGVLTPSNVEQGENVMRIWAGTSSSSSGLYCLLPAATLSTIMIRRIDRPPSVAWMLLALGGVILSLLGTLITGQRIATFAALLCFALSLATYLTSRHAGRKTQLLGILFILLATGSFFAMDFDEVARTFYTRMEQLQSSPEESGLNLRIAFYAELVDHLTAQPSLLAPGMSAVIQRLGTIAHFVIGEAYFEGGIVLMVALGSIIVLSLVRAGEEWRHDRSTGRSLYGAAMFITTLGFFLILSADPGLHTRLVYMILGLAIAGGATRGAV